IAILGNNTRRAIGFAVDGDDKDSGVSAALTVGDSIGEGVGDTFTVLQLIDPGIVGIGRIGVTAIRIQGQLAIFTGDRGSGVAIRCVARLTRCNADDEDRIAIRIMVCRIGVIRPLTGQYVAAGGNVILPHAGVVIIGHWRRVGHGPGEGGGSAVARGVGNGDRDRITAIAVRTALTGGFIYSAGDLASTGIVAEAGWQPFDFIGRRAGAVVSEVITQIHFDRVGIPVVQRRQIVHQFRWGTVNIDSTCRCTAIALIAT